MAAKVSTRWGAQERLGAIFCRMSNAFRIKYRIDPGLYATGEPDSESDVFVSANYKFSFDMLRRALVGKNAWILVLETNGILKGGTVSMFLPTAPVFTLSFPEYHCRKMTRTPLFR
jgi:hypothetical protein